jgi:putative transposase
MRPLARPEAFKVKQPAVEHYARNGKWWAQFFLAMPDHLHALISFPPEAQMEKVVRDRKRYAAKPTGVVWQDGFFDHRLRDNENLQEKARCLRMNPVRAGLISRPEKWPYVWQVSPRPETARKG